MFRSHDYLVTSDRAPIVKGPLVPFYYSPQMLLFFCRFDALRILVLHIMCERDIFSYHLNE